VRAVRERELVAEDDLGRGVCASCWAVATGPTTGLDEDQEGATA